MFEVSAWFGGAGRKGDRSKATFGIRVGVSNREQFFDPSWTEIEVEMDGIPQRFNLTSGFWRKCPEFRDSGKTVIREWLQRHRTLNWVLGSPPKMTLVPLGGSKFRLVA